MDVRACATWREPSATESAVVVPRLLVGRSSGGDSLEFCTDGDDDLADEGQEHAPDVGIGLAPGALLAVHDDPEDRLSVADVGLVDPLDRLHGRELLGELHDGVVVDAGTQVDVDVVELPVASGLQSESGVVCHGGSLRLGMSVSQTSITIAKNF